MIALDPSKPAAEVAHPISPTMSAAMVVVVVFVNNRKKYSVSFSYRFIRIRSLIIVFI